MSLRNERDDDDDDVAAQLQSRESANPLFRSFAANAQAVYTTAASCGRVLANIFDRRGHLLINAAP